MRLLEAGLSGSAVERIADLAVGRALDRAGPGEVDVGADMLGGEVDVKLSPWSRTVKVV